jgi:hypothetical protein
MRDTAPISVALIIAMLFTGAPPAEGRPQAGTVAYEAAFYTQFSPRTALDMVSQTPGFVLDLGEADGRRGFEGSVGNVLIDGERPTAKGEGAGELLRGIPAARVERIELRRASETVGDASGTRLLANVVLQPATWQGAWSGGVELANRYRPAPNGFASLAGGVGATDVVLSATSYSLFRHLPGTRLLRDATGSLSATRDVSSPRHFREFGGSGQAVRRVAGGRLEVTAKTSADSYADHTALTTEDAVSGTSIERVPYGQRQRSTEAGGSYKRAALGWEWTALSLLTWTHFDSHVMSTREAGPTSAPVVEQTSRRDTNELVARVSVVRVQRRGSSQIGVEGIRNSLKGLSVLTLNSGSGPTELPLPNASVRVNEDRGELFASQSWRPSDYWSLDGRIGVEVSTLRFHGDVVRSVTLAYAKPSLSVTRTFSNQTQLHARLHRTIGQLNFADFVATTSLADRQSSGANPELRPEASWRVEAGADFRLNTSTGIRVTVFRNWLDNAVDWTVWTDGDQRVDARGNIGPGTSTGVTLSYHSPVWPVPGLAVTAGMTTQATRVVDPLSGLTRRLSDRESVRAEVTFRQSLPKAITLGASYTHRSGVSTYRLHEIDWRRESPQLDAFAEWPVPRGLRLRVQGASLLAQPGLRRRTLFEPDRSHGPVGTEEIDSRPGRWLVVSLSGSF